MRNRLRTLLPALLATVLLTVQAQEARIDLSAPMLVNESGFGSAEKLIDEQRLIVGPPVGKPTSTYVLGHQFKDHYPSSVHLDFGTARHLSSLWLFDTNDKGDVVISIGEPENWQEVASYDCGSYQKWAQIPINGTTRYLRLTKMSPGANFSEIALYEYTPEAFQELQAKRAAEESARAAREAALATARAEMKKRGPTDLGTPFTEVYLVDEIDCAATPPELEDPARGSEVQTILGRPCRVLLKSDSEAAFFSYRIGRLKPLLPGQAYVLAIDYPEDAPRTVTVMTSANESSRTFHTGSTVGDALHPKYVNNLPESLRVPLSGKYESWTMLFQLHDRFPDHAFIRGSQERPETPEDGFLVTIAQFNARNIPLSHGAAVSRIRLFAVPDIQALHVRPNLPPEGLPQRHIFWREEMADGLIGSEKSLERGLDEPLDWYRYKATQMHVLGINTFAKDLLEFGACQHWDSTPGGGNQWVHFNAYHKDLWGRIVTLMGEEGFNLLPYYEYSGSKGQQGLGNQRRAIPLTRDGDYTHIAWRDKYNVDLTDPDTWDDFRKMLDHTIIRHRNAGNFVGAWLRNRGQMPMSFAPATLQRFADETLLGLEGGVTRRHLLDDEKLLQDYYAWWFGKRRDFLVAMRDHLRGNNVNPDAFMLYTASPNEPGISFADSLSRLVTDDPESWAELLVKPLHQEGNRQLTPVTVDQVIQSNAYLTALLSPARTWGEWEWQHLAPPSDPQNYKNVEGVLLTHAFNRLYTVASATTFDAFRSPAGLAIIRHYSLNENMMFDVHDQPKVGYFVTDVERAGPYCMMAEAVAMAKGDPTMIGYLLGGNHARGFPDYVRRFNLAFLSLPALPSSLVPGAASDDQVVIRRIDTPEHGTWLSVVNTGMTDKQGVTITLPLDGKLIDAATATPLPTNANQLRLDLHPYELRSLHIQ